jgi:Zn-finger nucleic acid-binding protein
MFCPACKRVDMFVLEYELLEVDYCPRCHGVWLDSGELALIGQRAGALHGELLAAIEQQKGEQQTESPPRRCPVCRKRLRIVTAQTEHGIVIDRCPRGDGLWFDRGELAAVVKAAGGDESNVLARFFAELGGPGKEKDNL